MEPKGVPEFRGKSGKSPLKRQRRPIGTKGSPNGPLKTPMGSHKAPWDPQRLPKSIPKGSPTDPKGPQRHPKGAKAPIYTYPHRKGRCKRPRERPGAPGRQVQRSPGAQGAPKKMFFHGSIPMGPEPRSKATSPALDFNGRIKRPTDLPGPAGALNPQHPPESRLPAGSLQGPT